MKEARFQFTLMWDILGAVWCSIKTMLHMKTRTYDYTPAPVVDYGDEGPMEQWGHVDVDVLFPW